MQNARDLTCSVVSFNRVIQVMQGLARLAMGGPPQGTKLVCVMVKIDAIFTAICADKCLRSKQKQILSYSS